MQVTQIGSIKDIGSWLEGLRLQEKASDDGEVLGGCLASFGVCLLFIPLMGTLSLLQTTQGKNVTQIVVMSLMATLLAIPSLHFGNRRYRAAKKARYHPGRLEFARKSVQFLQAMLKKGSSMEASGDLRQLPREHIELLRDYAKPQKLDNGLYTISRDWFCLKFQLEGDLKTELLLNTETRFQEERRPGSKGPDGQWIRAFTCIRDVTYQSTLVVKLYGNSPLELKSDGEEFKFKNWGTELSQPEPHTLCLTLKAPESQTEFLKSVISEKPFKYLAIDPALDLDDLSNALTLAQGTLLT